jgi:hypothetical protein
VPLHTGRDPCLNYVQKPTKILQTVEGGFLPQMKIIAAGGHVAGGTERLLVGPGVYCTSHHKVREPPFPAKVTVASIAAAAPAVAASAAAAPPPRRRRHRRHRRH